MSRQTAMGWRPIVVLHQKHDDAGSTEPLGATINEGSLQLDIRALPPIHDGGRKAYYSRRPASAPGVAELFADLKPTIAHFHTLNAAAGLRHLEAAKAVNARTVVTYHTGGISCPQTGLLENGVSPCDGRLEITRCTRCRFANRGMPEALANILARIPATRGNEIDGSFRARLLSSRSMTEAFIRSFRSAVELIDVFHIQSRWIREVLRANGVPDKKIAFVEMGVSQSPVAITASPVDDFCDARPLQLVFAGRCSDTKGIETILEALERIDSRAPITMTLLGPGWFSDYGRRLLKPFQRDKRLHPPRAVASETMLCELAQHDACLVPSVWLETGPLAVYEAMAAGLPVIGSRLGGIEERVRDNVDGLLFPPGDAKKLASIIENLLASPNTLDRLRKNIRPQRTFDDMARELDLIYRS
jgi:glycosyltransferase involved in cell wall biosynthesis